MRTALEEARTGASEGGLPIGAALVDAHGRLVVTGSNCRDHRVCNFLTPLPVSSRRPSVDSGLRCLHLSFCQRCLRWVAEYLGYGSLNGLGGRAMWALTPWIRPRLPPSHKAPLRVGRGRGPI